MKLRHSGISWCERPTTLPGPRRARLAKSCRFWLRTNHSRPRRCR